MPRKKKEETPETVIPEPAPERPKSRFAEVFAQAKANEEYAETVEAETDPMQDRAEAVAEKLAGTPVGREMLATVLTGAVDALTEGVAAFLTKLENDSEGVETVTTEDGTEYKLIGLDTLTGWRRRQAWKLLLSMAGSVKTYWQHGLDMVAIAEQIAGGDKGVELLGLAYGPVGSPYDKEKVIEYGEAVDDVLTTKQIAVVVMRFFSLSGSSIATFSRNSLAVPVARILESLQTISPTRNETSAAG